MWNKKKYSVTDTIHVATNWRKGAKSHLIHTVVNELDVLNNWGYNVFLKFFKNVFITYFNVDSKQNKCILVKFLQILTFVLWIDTFNFLNIKIVPHPS